ncbi:MAG TPA: YkgJ family cysteine cluster protein [Geobacteraceae bacterium]
MNAILRKYADLLGEVDAWFARCLEACPAEISCRAGCAECCRGLFDITLLDACLLKEGFDRLDAATRQRVLGRVAGHLARMRMLWPEFDAPYVLNYRPEGEWEELMPDEDETPCVLLEEGRCLLYAYRPMTCRLHGIPHVDVSGEVIFDEWCTLNFPSVDPLRIESLSGEFCRIFDDELKLFQSFTTQLLNQQLSELDTFIPTALLMDFVGFDWRGWLEKTPLVTNPTCE